MKVKKLQNFPENAQLKYQNDGDSCFDLVAALEPNETIVLAPGEIKIIPTGIAIALTYGFEAQVRARSGLAAKHGISLVNGIGTVDNAFRGEVKAIVANHGTEPLEIFRGMRMCQLAIQRVYQADIEFVDELPETGRGANGFGSTGV